jgi:hypothetical protein
MHEAVPLGAQSEYATLEEEELDEGNDAKYNVNENSGRCIAECLLLLLLWVGRTRS